MEPGNNNIVHIYKRIGETPKEAIFRYRTVSNTPEDIPITYAGRLDPMAEGVLLLLVGDAVHQKDDYLKLEKEYTFSILFGFETDTYDTLGLVTDIGEPHVGKERLAQVLKESVGSQEQLYPPYSSKPVDGKPLFQWAREGELDKIKIPTHNVTICDLWLTDITNRDGATLKERIIQTINTVHGDFRQEEIQEAWNHVLQENTDYTIVTCNMTCSSGTYVRSLVHEVGKKLDVPATTLSIVRNRVGDYALEDAVR